MFHNHCFSCCLYRYGEIWTISLSTLCCAFSVLVMIYCVGCGLLVMADNGWMVVTVVDGNPCHSHTAFQAVNSTFQGVTVSPSLHITPFFKNQRQSATAVKGDASLSQTKHVGVRKSHDIYS